MGAKDNTFDYSPDSPKRINKIILVGDGFSLNNGDF